MQCNPLCNAASSYNVLKGVTVLVPISFVFNLPKATLYSDLNLFERLNINC